MFSSWTSPSCVQVHAWVHGVPAPVSCFVVNESGPMLAIVSVSVVEVVMLVCRAYVHVAPFLTGKYGLSHSEPAAAGADDAEGWATFKACEPHPETAMTTKTDARALRAFINLTPLDP